MFWFSDDDRPVFAGPNEDGQFGKWIAARIREDSPVGKFLMMTGLYSVLRGGENTKAGKLETVFGGYDDTGSMRKLTVYLPKPPPPQPPAPPAEQHPATMPGYFLANHNRKRRPLDAYVR